MPNYRRLTPAQLLSWIEHNRDIMRLHTDLDILPGGYMAATAPALVAWQESTLSEPDGVVILRNVNYGGNPLERTTVLHSARIPLDGIEAAEFTLVPLNRQGTMHHAQIRFIFAPDRSPELLNLAGKETGTLATFSDLVMSWHAWRPPEKKLDFKAAMDAESYGLTLRAFVGPQLFLEDSLQGRDWFSHRLQLPGSQAGLQELFKVVLAVGDGVARNTIGQLLSQDENNWETHAPSGDGESAAESEAWQQLKARLDSAPPAEFPTESLPDSDLTYQPLVRSCATMARYTVLLATWRMIAQGHSEGVNIDKLPEAELSQVEGWMKTSASADLRQLFLSAPAALRFMSRNPQVIPTRIPHQLDAAGLVVRKNGKPWEIRYGRKASRLYNSEGANLFE